MNNTEIIAQILKENNISYNELQIQQLNDYYNLLIEYNQKFNLTNITEKYMKPQQNILQTVY